ncbi:MAG: alpha-glucan family phosphorylase [Deltaproteobacteria bacterium]|nr:alpha-glucan family phosphorylase [Deltaproteobacteria bacterium]
MHVQTVYVKPKLLPAMQPLARLLGNCAWSYDPGISRLVALLRDKIGALGRPVFQQAPPYSWLETLTTAEQEALVADAVIAQEVQKTTQALAQKPAQAHIPPGGLIAYFSAEYGIHETLPIYAGGLGILAGDHLKSAGDLGLPLVGVGLFYGRGYHEQHIGADGTPAERYVHTDPQTLGARLCTLPNGGRLTVHVRMAARAVHLQVWELEIGRTKLYLLDSDVPENAEPDRRITQNLYGGGHDTRIEQELALGVGGTFALEALGIAPTVYHINEGHAAFLSLARLHIVRRDLGLDLDAAAELVAAGNVFTTHTPIAAGNDVFSHGALVPYLSPLCESLGLPLQWVLDQGVEQYEAEATGYHARFSMTAFAIQLSAHRNGVSLEHGEVSRRLWHALFPGHAASEVPIGAVVNGVHLPTWTHPEMLKHYGKARPDHQAFAQDKRRLRHTLIDHINKRRPSHLRFDPDVCTIGFARRFAEYKRALLLFSDPERLRHLLSSKERRVQLVFAGKAHPHNTREKANIKALHDLIHKHGLEASIAFVENYDMRVARLLVQGVDVWLNTPRPPLEASGTSGMKVIQNGGLNVSIRDGWWKEAYEPEVGWAIGADYDQGSPLSDAARDSDDAQDLYRIIESEVLPLFYSHDERGVPVAWIDKCYASGRALAPKFHAVRMVEQYARDSYAPAHKATTALLEDNGRVAKSRADARAHAVKAFQSVTVEWLEQAPTNAPLGERIKVKARVKAAFDDLVVEVLSGVTQERTMDVFEWQNVRVTAAEVVRGPEPGEWIATAQVDLPVPGTFSLALRVRPRIETALVHRLVRFA